MSKQINVGRRCGKLIVIEQIGSSNSHSRPRKLYKCLCDCGNFTIVNSGKLSPTNTQSTRSCGCLRSETATLTKRKGTAAESTARLVWSRYKDGCSFEEFMKLSQQNCFYCGTAPSRTANYRKKVKGISEEWATAANFTYNGLDRVDSSKEHISSNIVPCCTTCNTMKMSLSQKEFLTHVKKIYHHSLFISEAL